MPDVFNNAFPSSQTTTSTTVSVPISQVASAGNPAFGWETRTGRGIKLRVLMQPRKSGDGERRVTVEHAQEMGHDTRTITAAGIDIQGNEELYLLPTAELGGKLIRGQDVLEVEGVRKRVIGTVRPRNGVYRTHQLAIVRQEL